MGYFDLNIPYPESSHANKSTVASNRTRLAVKAMELGYTGIAYNRTMKGVMSDHHRCSILPLSLSSLLNVLPFLSQSAKLHRDLLGIPSSTPFHQYTRLTVCVETPSQAQALNSGNPILKTYDLVAVKPSNQVAFDLACGTMEVDIISIDFSTKLPFRLKQPMVKAATQRGVCFEVTYSGLLADVQMRRQIISSAKLLMDWTRGRNIVFSSAAPSVNEIRGPCDVANVLSLFGLSKEQANAAISKNCRILLANSLRKKQFYKEAIKVEFLSSDVASHSKEAWHQELLKWDPISSGEGDILLDDMAKSCSASYKASKTAKAVDFVSVVHSLPSHGFRVQDFLPPNDAFPVSPSNKSTPIPNDLTEQPKKLDVCPEHDESSSLDGITKHHIVSCDNFFEKIIHSGTTEAFNSMEIDTETNGGNLELKNFIDSDVPLDDSEKSFSASCKASRTAKAIDSVSVVDSFPSHDFQIKDLLPAKYAYPVLPYNKVNLPPVAEKVNQSEPVPNNSTEQPNRLDVCPEQDERSLSDAITTHHVVSCDNFFEKNIHSGTTEVFNSKEEIDTQTNARELELKNFIDSDVDCTPFGAKALDSQSDMCISSNALETVKPHENKKLLSSSDDAHNIDDKVEIFTPSMDSIFPALLQDKHNNEKSADVNLNAQIAKMQEILPKEDFKIAGHTVLEINTSTTETSVEDGQFGKRETDVVKLDEMPQQTPFDEMKMEDDSTVAMPLLPEVIMEDKKFGEVSTDSDQFASVQSVSGRLRVKQRTPRGPLLFPLKRMLNLMAFKKKGKKIKSRTNLK